MLADDLGQVSPPEPKSMLQEAGSFWTTIVSPKGTQQILSIQCFFCEVGEISPFDREAVRTKSVTYTGRPTLSAQYSLTPGWPWTGPPTPRCPAVRQPCRSYKWFGLVSLSFPRWSEARGCFLLLPLLFLLVSSESILPLVKGSKLITRFPPTTISSTTNWLDNSRLLYHFGIFWVRYK